MQQATFTGYPMKRMGICAKTLSGWRLRELRRLNAE
jgi:hypothetical protein